MTRKIQVIVLLGPPGSGKGTQAQLLQKKRPSWIHVSTGNLFRAEINSGSTLGLSVKDTISSGNLVSDEVTNQVFRSQVKRILAENAEVEALILDGYPRTAAQAQDLISFISSEDELASPVALELRVSEGEVVGRLADRLVNPRTGRVYHRKLNPPKTEGIDDLDGQALIQRPDDQPDVIKARYALYLKERDGIVSGLGGPQHLVKVDGVGPLESVGSRLYGSIQDLQQGLQKS